METNLQHPIECKDGVYADLGTSENALHGSQIAAEAGGGDPTQGNQPGACEGRLSLEEAADFVNHDTRLPFLWDKAAREGRINMLLRMAHDHVAMKFGDAIKGDCRKWAVSSFLAGLLRGESVNSSKFYEPLLCNGFFVPNLYVVPAIALVDFEKFPFGKGKE